MAHAMTKKTSSKRRKGPDSSDTPATTLDACRRCGAKCCHDLVMPINKPRNEGDLADLRWELQYDTVRVYIRSHRWYRIIQGRCMYLTPDNLCRIYERRPRRCREHNPPECEFYGKFYQVMISTPEELDAHLAKEKARRR